MSPAYRPLMLASVDAVILASLAAILFVERAVWPRVWVKTVVANAAVPPRGRYATVRIEFEAQSGLRGGEVALSVRAGRLVATPSALPTGTRLSGSLRWGIADAGPLLVDPPLTVFLPAYLTNPWPRPPDEEVWVEVTVPAHGAPRPIRLGVKKDGLLRTF